MSAPQGNFVQGLLQSLQPWLTGGSPSALDQRNAQYGGTNGLISALLQDSPGSGGASAMGRALVANKSAALNQAAARQSLAQQNLGLQFMAARMPLVLQRMRQAAGGNTGSAAPAPQDAPPMIRATPQQLSAQGQPANYLPPPSTPSAGAGPSNLLRAAQFDAWWNPKLADTERGIAALQMQYSPQLASQMAMAKNPLTQDQLGYQQALQAGDKTGAEAWYMKYLKDAGMVNVAAYNGAVTTLGGLSPGQLGVSTINPVQGVGTQNGVEYALPGAAGARAAIAGAQAGAEESARLRAQTAPVGSSGGGSGTSPTTPTPLPLPQVGASVEPSGWSAVQTQGFVPPLLEKGGNAKFSPGNTGGAELVNFQKEQAEGASHLLNDLQAKADNAQNVITQTQEIDAAATQFTPGAYANIRGKLLAALQPTGWLSGKQLSALASYQTASKITINLQTALTKSLGSREAAQVFDRLGHAVTNVSLSPQGLQMLSGWQKGMARWQQIQNTYAQRLRGEGNVAAINNLPATFQTNSNPAYFILASLPANLRAHLIAESPDPNGLMTDWKKAAQQGLAPMPNDFGTHS